MLGILNAKLPEDQRHRISRQNIVDFSADRRFALVLAPFRVMMHLTGKEDQLRAINNVYDHLEPGGRFIFDVFIPDLKQLISGLSDVTDFEGEYEPGKKVRRTVNTRPDLLRQIINVSFHMEWDSEDGIGSDDWTFAMRYYFRYELEHLIERSSFREYKIYGDYKGSELNEASKEFVVICKK
jgi:SAM-dependent methyltransferase